MQTTLSGIMNSLIEAKREEIQVLKDSPCFSGKHRRIKTLNKQLSNLIKKQKYKARRVKC